MPSSSADSKISDKRNKDPDAVVASGHVFIPGLEGYRCSESLLTGSDIYLTNPVPLFFQTGYLTIKGYNSRFNQYVLGFPNKEVTEGFSDFLMNSYMRHSDSNNNIGYNPL